MPPQNNSENNRGGGTQDPAAVARAGARGEERREQMQDIIRKAQSEHAAREEQEEMAKERAVVSQLTLAERQARIQAENLARKKAKIVTAGEAPKKLDGAGFWIVFALAVIADIVPFLAVLVTVSFAEEAARIGGVIANTIKIITGIINLALLPTGPVAAAIFVVRHALIKQAEKFLIQKTAEAVFQFVLAIMGMFLFLLDVTVGGIIWFYLLSQGVFMRRGIVGGLVGAFALKLFPLVPSFSVSLLLIRRRVNKDADGSIVGGKT